MEPAKLLATARQHHQENRHAEARTGYLEVLAVDSNNPQACYGLAILACQAGDFKTGEQYIRQVIKQAPADPHLHNTLASILKSQGKTDAAVQQFQLTLEYSPRDFSALTGLAVLFRDCKDFNAAINYFQRASAVHPDDTSVWSLTGDACWQAGRYDDATSAFRKAADISPALGYTHENLGNALLQQGYYEEALKHMQLDARLSRTAGSMIRANTCIPPIMESTAQVAAARQQLHQNLRQLIASAPTITDPMREIGKTNFFLAYHGEDDRELQMLFAELYRKACPDLVWISPHCVTRTPCHGRGKITIGFISSYFRNHSIARTSTRIIAGLPRDRFHVVAIFTEPQTDEMAMAIQQAADETIMVGSDLATARRILAARALDILYYQDIGMDAFTYFLAYSRLAPVQCTSFGHPVTCGIPNIDYYISTRAWEPPDGAAHYSEKLVTLDQAVAVTSYEKPALPRVLKTRAEFGLPQDRNIYICPQALFKFHPDFDDILAGILHADPHGTVVIMEGLFPAWSQLICARLARVIPDSGQRIQVLPRQHSSDFINLIAVADVMLDTIHFCGFNTTLEAFSTGTPVVTLPGRFMRSRHTAAYYRKMGITECIAESATDYIRIAVRLGTDRNYRAEMSKQILCASESIWNDETVINELADAFQSMFTSHNFRS